MSDNTNDQYPEKVTVIHQEDSMDVSVQDVVERSKPETWDVDNADLEYWMQDFFVEITDNEGNVDKEQLAYYIHCENMERLFSGEYAAPMVFVNKIVNPDGSEPDEDTKWFVFDDFIENCEEGIRQYYR